MRRTVRVTSFILLVILLVFAHSPAFAVDESYARLDGSLLAYSKVDQFITSQMKSNGIPGLALAILQNGKIVYCKGYGFADIEARQPVDEQTIFEAASLGKPVFAYAVLKLAQEKKIDLDKPLYQYLEYKDIESDPRSKLITARMVLSHTTGLPNWRDEKGLRFLYDPGERFSYSGEGFLYLQLVVEKLCGKPADEVVRACVFEPFQMNRSSFVWKPAFANNYASGYDKQNRLRAKTKPTYANVAGTLHTSISDYAKFLAQLATQLRQDGSIAREMLRPQVILEGQESGHGVFWGLGCGLQKNRQGIALWHWGDNGCYKNFVILYEKQQTGIVYFSNSANGLQISRPIVTELTRDNDQRGLNGLLGSRRFSLVVGIGAVGLAVFAVFLFLRRRGNAWRGKT